MCNLLILGGGGGVGAGCPVGSFFRVKGVSSIYYNMALVNSER